MLKTQSKEKKVKKSKSIATKNSKEDEVIITVKKEDIENKTQIIPNNVETTYYQLEEEENKFSNLAEELGLNYSIIKTNDTDIYSNIIEIKSNMKNISKKVQKVQDTVKLDKVIDVLQEVENLAQDRTIKKEHSVELKETFEKSFDNKVQDLIRSSKISKLQQERGQVEREKVSLFAKIMGKEKLKQARISNIDLKMQLLELELENQTGKTQFSLEDSLSDLYAYFEYELGRKIEPEMKQSLEAIQNNLELKQMIDKENIKLQIEQKVNSIKNIGKLVPIKENKKVSNRQQADILQVQNSEINREIQNTRARTLTRQNILSTVQNSKSALSKFQNIVDEINSSTHIEEIQ